MKGGIMYVTIVEEDEEFEHQIGESIFGLRRFNTEIYRQIRKRHTKAPKFRRNQMIDQIDEDAINADLLDYMIKWWKKVKSSVTGKDVECTKENKLKLPGSAQVEIIEACDQDGIMTEIAEDKKKGADAA
jgi:hypothetical protein